MEEEINEKIYKLECVRELINEAFNSEDKALRLADFSAASALVQRLEKSNGRYDLDYNSGLEKRLSEIKYHFAAMLGLDVSHGDTVAQHYAMAIEAIDAAKSSY